MLALPHSLSPAKWCLFLAILCCPIFLIGQLDGDPCNAIRWEGGATWNIDSSIDDTPNGQDGIANMAPVNGIIRCGNSAETQSNIQSTGIYDPTDFVVDIAGFSCVEPSTGTEVFPVNPTANQPIIWMNFDVRPLAGTFQVQINDNSGDLIAWALYYSDTPTSGVSLNTATGEYLSGDCSALNLAACGVESANTWNTLPVPDFADVTNYYLVVWDQNADGNLSVNNFKARFGCGGASVELCSIALDGVSTECNDDNTYTVSVNVSGINGQFVAYDANALQNPSDPICLSNPGENDPVTNGTLTMTYNAGQMYSITVAEVTPSTIPGCSEPFNTEDCIITGISGMAPVCCELIVECPDGMNVSCLSEIPVIDDSDITIVSSCGPAVVSTSSTLTGSGCLGDPYVLTYTYTVNDDENTFECQVVHHATDLTPPTIDCPADATVDCNADTSPAATGTANGSDNCGGVAIAFSDSSAPGCGNTQVITRTWTATDDCGNQSSCDQTITTSDTTPPTIDCPADATVDCNADTSPAATGTATGSDNCGGVAITFSDSSAPGCGNTQVITRTWTATDDCGNQSSCDQTITTSDTTPPTIDCPADATVDCNADTSPASTGTATGSDNCGGVNITFSDSSAPGCGNTQVITRTWTATDACGNQSSCDQTITTIDLTPPTIDCPADATVDCNADTSPAATGTATGSDNCGGVAITFSDSSTSGCGNTQVITRTWTATDDCGNQSSCDQTITTTNNTPPSIVCPPDLTIDCNADTSPASTGTATATDNCGNVTITFSDQVQFGCGNTQVIFRTWTAVDACGNPSTCLQTITTIDNTPPTIDCPADVTIECDVDTSPANTGTASATDNCGAASVDFSDSSVPGCGNTQVITRTWTATDNCGNQNSCQQIITTVDTTPPVIVCPPDQFSECFPGPEALTFGNDIATATDNCGFALLSVQALIEETCGNTVIQHLTWTATDLCGNTSTCESLWTSVDTTPPTINCPADVTIDCTESTSPDNTGSATGFDICGSVSITFEDSSTSGCGSTQVITRTWTATDDCGNQSSCDQTITTTNNTPPSIVCPPDITIDCNADSSPASTGTASGSDNCGGVNITFSDSSVPGCGNTQVITRTWTATDACGNQSSCDQTITTIDLTPPTIDCPADATVDCNADTSPAATGTATGSDNCGDVNITFSDSSAPGCGNTQVITRTWTATDECGNQSSCDQTITTIDNTPPTIDCPADATVDCNADTSPAATGTATGSDNCGGVNITFADIAVPGCGFTHTISREWIATDACGNSTSCTQTIVVIDNTPPTIVCPPDAVLDCNADTSPANTGTASGSDNCGSVSITFADNVTPGCGNTQTIIRTWTATDACGNSSSCDQTIATVDQIPPVLWGVPADEVIGCLGELPPVAEVFATDNCDDQPQVTFIETIDDSGCPIIYTRTWTATDDCGNSSEVAQTITFADDEPPVILPFDFEVSVECDDLESVTIDATDQCGDVIITFEDVLFSGGCLGTIYRTWIVTDLCGNATTAEQYIQLLDTTPPAIHGVGDNMEMDCTETPELPEVWADDNCGGDVSLAFNESIIPGDCPQNYTIVWTWTATDYCDLVTVVTKTINISDQTPPVFETEVEDFSLACGEEAPPVPEVSATDDCGTVTITMTETTDPGFCPQNYTLVRIWTATDECGNAAELSQSIEFTDTEAPVFTFVPEDVTAECSDDLEELVAMAEDACGIATLSSDDEIIPTDCASEYTIVRTFTAVDECGNAAEAQQLITIIDTQAPEFNDLPESLIIDCEAEIPTAPILTAFDACDGDVEVVFEETFEGDFPDPDALNDCQLLTAEGPYYDPDWALWLQGIPEPYRYYTVVDGSWKDYPDGTAHIEATLVSTDNPNGGLLVDVWFNPGMTWAEWSTQGYPTGYKDDFGLGGDFYEDWLYYIMDNNNATLTGWGDFAGSSFTLQHAPSNLYYGYQLGEAANNSNANYGSGGWFTFSGVLMDSSSDFNQELNGSGDMAFDHDCCLQYEVTWTWTATDCAGNSTTHSATVNFEDLGGVPQVPGAPGICPADFDSDGHIGTSDLLMLLAAYGCWADCQIDLNGDGQTTTSDMLSFLSAYGTDCD